ncbi:hypothetical protein GCM10025881_17710 [Pseudolysinimonas kribbensis]|uniref:UDP-glucose 4-epimerase n=1 Tax=Pseudolysinimonas kribbensis TaxID=433641 RepID=A0ABQ6K2U5_9MICO|nr:hypothetical protein GCM10025881_17710 [Pseudolysinimonas kribbensis]
MAMKILVIGGTGIIGRACVELAVSRGLEVDVLTRGRRPVPDGARPLGLDISDVDAARRQLRDREYGAVIDWLAFTPEDIARHLELLRGRIGQYVFISSASAYQTPPLTIPVTEKTPLSNPYWRYSRDKIACEEMLAGERSVPITVVRPSHTYDRTMVPFDGGGPLSSACATGSRSSCPVMARRCGR